MDENIFISVNKNLSREDKMMLSPLQLAYVGDAVYELFVRTYILDNNLSVHELHKEATNFVSAQAQAELIHRLEEDLTDREIRIVKRGRNAKSHTSPKNMDMIDYKYSTGFEALFGYLYINEEEERLLELFEKIIGFYREEIE